MYVCFIILPPTKKAAPNFVAITITLVPNKNL